MAIAGTGPSGAGFFSRGETMSQSINPFMTLRHCAKFATRQAFRTGEVMHVIATPNTDAPLAVIDDQSLFERADRIAVEDLLFTADPFGDAAAG